MSARPTLTLVVPGLSQVSDPDMARILARADQDGMRADGVVSVIGTLAGIDGAFPAGALSAHSANLPGGNWMRLDPVHLVADPDGLRLLPGEQLDIEDDEAAALGAFITANTGIPIHRITPEYWVAPALAEHADLYPVHDAAGCHIGALLPEGEARMRYRAWLNELQMVMHDAPVNQRRRDAGVLTINSVWAWGRGALPVASRWPFAMSYAADPMVAGLAELAGHHHGGPLHTFLQLPSDQDAFVWAKSPAGLAEDWVIPAWEALRRGELAQVRVLDETGSTWTLRSGMRWRFWRRP